MKKLIFGLIFLSFALISNAQSFKGFFKPVTNVFLMQNARVSENVLKDTWLFRPTVGISAIKMQYTNDNRTFVTTSCQTLGTGISYQRFSNITDVPYCELAINGLILYNLDLSGSAPINLGGAVTVGVFNNLFSGGIGWDFNQKYPFILMNVSLNLNK